MSNDLEFLKKQKMSLWFDNLEIIRKLENTRMEKVDLFNLGVIVGKREERKKRKTSPSNKPAKNTQKELLKSLIDEISSQKALDLMTKYLECVRQREWVNRFKE